MRSKSIVLILIAAVCGTVAAAGVSQAIKSSPEGAPVALETEKIFVAAKEIDIREAFSADNVRLEEWPKSKIPEGAITSLEQIEGQYARTRLFEGEVILHKKLMSENEAGSHEITIPPGYRVKSVQVTMASAVSNLVMPGSRVDVLVFLKEGGGVPNTGAYTILRNVRVFAVNDRVERDIDTDGQTITAKTVSLLVKPDQVEKLLIASSVGRLELSLRRPDDQTDEEKATDSMTALNELLGGRAELGVEKAASKTSEPAGSFAEFLRQDREPARPAPVAVAEPVIEDPASAATMTVMTPEGAKQYRWSNPNQLPQEVVGGGAFAPAPATTPTPSGAPVSSSPSPADGVARGQSFPGGRDEETLEEEPN